MKNKKNIIEDDYQKSVVNTKRLNIKNLLRMIVNLIRFSSGDIHYLAPNRKQRIISNIILKYRQKASYKYFNKNVPENKYVYFPLSMIPEASTLIRGTKYYNQISTIKSLSLELPIHWKLVIKEHPSMIGKNPISFYKEINRIFNVVLLHSTFPSKDVIDKSEAVITVTGTTGLEALVLGKKTIVLGSSIYSGLESVFKVESISEIGDILRNAWTELDIEKQEKDMMLFASSLASADTFEDPDEILWTKKAFNPEMNQVDINIYNALMRKLSW